MSLAFRTDAYIGHNVRLGHPLPLQTIYDIFQPHHELSSPFSNVFQAEITRDLSFQRRYA